MAKEKISINELELITSDDLLGKDVIDEDGEFLGISESVFINPKTFEFAGISIDKGFLKKGLIIGKEYIKKITPYAIFLNTKPVFLIKGMSVFDDSGELIGKVKDIVLKENRNQIEKLIVSYSMFKKTLELQVHFIKSIGENVFLNLKKKDILQLIK